MGWGWEGRAQAARTGLVAAAARGQARQSGRAARGAVQASTPQVPPRGRRTSKLASSAHSAAANTSDTLARPEFEIELISPTRSGFFQEFETLTSVARLAISRRIGSSSSSVSAVFQVSILSCARFGGPGGFGGCWSRAGVGGTAGTVGMRRRRAGPRGRARFGSQSTRA
jgi:hypothetical protein